MINREELPFSLGSKSVLKIDTKNGKTEYHRIEDIEDLYVTGVEINTKVKDMNGKWVYDRDWTNKGLVSFFYGTFGVLNNEEFVPFIDLDCSDLVTYGKDSSKASDFPDYENVEKYYLFQMSDEAMPLAWFLKRTNVTVKCSKAVYDEKIEKRVWKFTVAKGDKVFETFYARAYAGVLEPFPNPLSPLLTTTVVYQLVTGLRNVCEEFWNENEMSELERLVGIKK
jgi:hypothetical protein